MKRNVWEAGLLVWLLMTLIACMVPIRAQNQLADKLTRLHVIANSDSREDQALKLQVRDAVLEASRGLSLEDSALTDILERAARDAVLREGYDYPVEVCRTRCWFDTREYDTFSLPAGHYNALRVVIGEGAGRNWWCVIYPPLCAGMCETDWETVAREAGLSEDEIGLICEKEGYVLRFRLADLWGRLAGKIWGK